METLRTNSNLKVLQINEGPEVLSFDPTDVTFSEKFYRLMRTLGDKEATFLARAKVLDKDGSVEDSLEFLKDTCKFFRDEIDLLFGIGTSQKLFGDSYSLDNIGKFFNDITPYISVEREKQLAKYLAPSPTKKRLKHKAVK